MDFILFWHRAGNTPAGIDAVHAAASRTPAGLGGRTLAHGVELDLKWTGTGPLLYAYHGPTGRERLRESAARRRAVDVFDRRDAASNLAAHYASVIDATSR